MELDFDKEIDALLRKARRDGPVYVGDMKTSRHLDADEISAFAENAMPEKSRALYMAHMADCDRCRKTLSSLLVLDSEVAPSAASLSAITIAERTPWYRKLFLFPNLAYVMGSLVLVFSGFLVYTVVRNSGSNFATVSQISSDAPRGPSFEGETQTIEAANSSANASSNAVGSMAMNSNAAVAPMTTPDSGAAGPRAGENNFVLDGDSPTDSAAEGAAAPPVASQPAPVGALKDAKERDDLAAGAKTEDKVAGVPLKENAKSDSMLKQAPATSNLPTQSGPMRNNENQYNRQLENLDRSRAAAKKSAGRDEEASSGKRSVSGKSFERKQGVWYDTGYQGRPTINVRRGSAEFNKLDSGLRSIANSLGGTVVVVWGAKAYRIQ